jgi:hypothetical protein
MQKIQHDLTESLLRGFGAKYKLELMYGFDFPGNTLSFPMVIILSILKRDGEKIFTIGKLGGFAEATKYFFKSKLKLNAVLRAEKK